MSDDGIECRVRYWANVPQRTHRIVCEGAVIGHVWSDGAWVMIDEEPPTAPQVPRSPSGGETQT